jgi:hypothetical protein
MAQITIRECFALPPCRHCGGRHRWLNEGQAPPAVWFWHCVRCAPPPAEGEAGALLPAEAEEA